MGGIDIRDNDKQGKEKENDMTQEEIRREFSHFNDFTNELTARLCDDYKIEYEVSVRSLSML